MAALRQSNGVWKEPAQAVLRSVRFSVVKGELLFGAVKSQVPVTTMSRLMQFMSAFESYPFDDRCAEVYARIRADLEKRVLPIGPNDTLIAATAIARQATVVTANTREFARIDGLRWEDWEAVGDRKSTRLNSSHLG